MTVLYFIIYLIVGLFLITILNYAMDGPTNDLDGGFDTGSILLILGWPIVIGAMLVFGIVYGIWSIAKAIGMAIYNWTWR